MTKAYGKESWKYVIQLPDGKLAGVTYGGCQIWEIDLAKDNDRGMKVYAGHKDGRLHQGGMKDGLATHSSFFRVDCISLLHDGSIAVSDSATCLLRLIISSPFGGKTVTTIAGCGEGTEGYRDGEALQAKFWDIHRLAYNPVDGSILIADDNRIRRYKDGVVNTVVDDEDTTIPPIFDDIRQLAVLSDGSIIVALDSKIKLISIDGIVSTIAGSDDITRAVDGRGANATFYGIQGLLVDANDDMYVADAGLCESQWMTSVRKVSKVGSTYFTSTILPPTSELHDGSLCSFTKDGDLIITEADHGILTPCPGRIHIVKTGCPLPPHLQKLYHSQIDPLLKGIFKERSDLFDNAADNMADITFKVEGRSIPAHRGVLMAGSDYFRTLFNSTMQAGDCSTTEVKETTYDALRTVLKYLYTKDHRDILTADNALDVYELTERYGVSPLQDKCVWYMQSSSNMEASVKWYIASKKTPSFKGAAPMLKSRLIKKFRELGERHADSVALLWIVTF